MATLSTQTVSRAGVTPTYAACTSGGDRFTPNSNTFLHVKNGGGSSQTVTIAATKVDIPNVPASSVAVAVAAGSEKMIGPFPGDYFLAVDGSGLADVTYSGVTSLTIAAVQVSQP